MTKWAASWVLFLIPEPPKILILNAYSPSFVSKIFLVTHTHVVMHSLSVTPSPTLFPSHIRYLHARIIPLPMLTNHVTLY